MHRRQFVLGPAGMSVHEDWHVAELSPGVFLSHDPELRVHRVGDRALLGLAVQTASGRPAPEAELGAAGLESLTPDWAGRWTLVDAGRLSQDAAGTLACFVRAIDGGTWASSSPELLRSLAPELALPTTRVVRGVGMDWFPPPQSGIDGIRQLLPTQLLELPRGAVVGRALPRPATGASPDELIASMAERLVNAIRGFASSGARLRLPLTAGRDSRVVLAAAVEAGAQPRTYLFETATLSHADRTLPPRLAASVGVDYELITAAAPQDAGRLALWDRHSAEHAMTADRDVFAAGQFARLTGDVDLGGNVFEVGRCYYHGVLPRDPGAGPEETAGLVLRELPTGRPQAVLEWARRLHETPDDTWDWRDRFYLEQRLGGWLGAAAQGWDLSHVPRVHIASCAAYIAATMALDEPMRRASAHQSLLIERLAPVLVREPFNAGGPLHARLRHRASRELAELRAQRTPWAYAAQRTRRLRQRRAS